MSPIFLYFRFYISPLNDQQFPLPFHIMLYKSHFDKSGIVSASTASTSILNKQLQHLLDKRSRLAQKFQYQKQHRSAIFNTKSSIVLEMGRLTTKQTKIHEAQRKMEQLEIQMDQYQQEKLITVIAIEDQETRLNVISQQLIECYKPNINQLDLLRLQLIQQECNPNFKQAEPVFSIRKAILMFVKDHGLTKSHYQRGVEIQISANGKTEQFRWFAIALLKESKHPNQTNLIESIQQYASLLLTAEKLIKVQQFRSPSVKSSDRQQLTVKVTGEREALAGLHRDLKEISQKHKDTSSRMNQLQKIIKDWSLEMEEIRLKIEGLKQKVRQLEAVVDRDCNLQAQLSQMDEAIDYFQYKQMDCSKVKSSTLIDLDKIDLFSPSSFTSFTSLPILPDPMETVSRIMKSPASHTFLLHSKKGASVKGKRKMVSPSRWK